jgi:hypothetical protein
VITSWEEFQRVFGTFSTTLTAPLAAYVFFQNGGSRLVVVRVASDDAVAATAYISTEVTETLMTGDGSDTTGSKTLAGVPILPGSLEIVYQRALLVTDEVLDSDAGGDAAFSGTLAHPGVTTGDVLIEWTSGGVAKSQTIAADGSVEGDGTPENTTLNRTTGEIYIDLTGDLPGASTAITATYRYYGPEITVTDDGEGALQSGATGSINYTTGALAVTFSNAPADDYVVSVVYRKKLFLLTMDHVGAYGNDCRIKLSGLEGYEDADSASFTRWNLVVEVLDANGSWAVAETFLVSLTDNTDSENYIVNVLNDATNGSEYFSVTEIHAGVPSELSGVSVEEDAAGDAGTALAGDGATLEFAGTLSNAVYSGSLVFTALKESDDSTMTLTDDGFGGFTGDGTGTIDYTTGEFSLTFEAEVKDGGAISAVYFAAPVNDASSPWTLRLSGGDDGSAITSAEVIGTAIQADRKGIYATERLNEVLMVIFPDFTGVKAVDQALLDYCHARENTDRFAVICPPSGYTPTQAIAYKRQVNRPEALEGHMYWPWKYVIDPATNRSRLLPPVFHAAGVISRTDSARGAMKAPAGVADGRLSLVVQLAYEVSDAEAGQLRSHQINVIRYLAQYQDPVVFGANTMERNGDYGMIHVARMLAVVKLNMRQILLPKVFEPNTPALRSQITLEITSYMERLRNLGWFYGASAAEGYSVICNDSNNPAAEVAQGRLTADVRFRPNAAAEFIVARVGLQGAGSSTS